MSDTHKKDDLKAVPRKEFVAILFPGVVKNDNKALECLGGLRNISEAYSQSSKERLGLSFQPNNPYVKKVFADIKKTSGILFKIKIKKTITGTEVKKEIISTSIMGQVKQCYDFNSLSDFQYLPVDTNVQPPQCILENILPSGLDTFEHFMNMPVQPFIVPSSFTRSDKPFVYAYTDKKDEKATNEDEEFHYKLRDRKIPLTPFIFNLVDEWPSRPQPYFLDQLSKSDEEVKKEYEIVKRLFDERPIWSKNALMFKTKIKPSSMKIILPCLGICPKIGPWKLLWIKYGYDPRIDPEARIYQNFDFRVRQDGLKCMVMPRDSTGYYRKVNHVKTHVAASGNVPEGAVFFRPGLVPPQRQIYYQYCDIELPEVQDMISVKPATGTLCHQSRGWLGPSVADKCRDLLYEHTRKAILASNTTVVYEGSSSSEDDDEASSSVNL